VVLKVLFSACATILPITLFIIPAVSIARSHWQADPPSVSCDDRSSPRSPSPPPCHPPL